MSAHEGLSLPRLPRGARLLLMASVGFLVFLLVAARLVGVYTSWLWFGEVGYREVWRTVLFTRLSLFAVISALVGGVLFTAMWLAFRYRPLVALPRTEDYLLPYRITVLRRPLWFGLGIAGAIGVVCGLIGQSRWTTVQLFLHGGSFGLRDPEFGHDIGFYVFDLPFYRLVVTWLLVLIFLGFLAGLATHYLFGGLRIAAGRPGLSHPARVQLVVFAGLFVLVKAIAYWLDRYTLLAGDSQEPTFTGAGYTDINAVLPAKLILFAIALICAAAFFSAVVVRDLRIPALAAAMLLLSSILVGGVWPLAVEQLSVRPNAADKQRVYIERNIAATRQAYGIGDDRVEYRPYPGIGTRPPRPASASATPLPSPKRWTRYSAPKPETSPPPPAAARPLPHPLAGPHRHRQPRHPNRRLPHWTRRRSPNSTPRSRVSATRSTESSSS
ncbi:COG1615 family transporter [Nocardia flavorosea]|uniref:COG1615 family transporter n=1 Tax=Nocardia flavorosea TaxID=53429 RepID=A0A846YHT5_9NOCA|nr:COG1615 family transporter [Nocardia flavorosea]